MNRQVERQMGRQTGRQMERLTERQMERLRQKGGWRIGQTSRQTGVDVAHMCKPVHGKRDRKTSTFTHSHTRSLHQDLQTEEYNSKLYTKVTEPRSKAFAASNI